MEKAALGDSILVGKINYWMDIFKKEKIKVVPINDKFTWNLVNGKLERENDTINNGRKYLIKCLNKVASELGFNSIKELGYKLLNVNSDKDSNKFRLPDGKNGITNLMIQLISGTNKQSNVVNIEIKRPYHNLINKNSSQTSFEIISANLNSDYPVLQLSTDLVNDYEIKILTKVDNEFKMVKWSNLDKDVAFTAIVFWLKFVVPKLNGNNKKNGIRKLTKYLKEIYATFKHVKGKNVEFINEIEKFEFKNFVNKMKKEYNYLNYNERCSNWLNSNYNFIINNIYEEVEENIE